MLNKGWRGATAAFPDYNSDNIDLIVIADQFRKVGGYDCQ